MSGSVWDVDAHKLCQTMFDRPSKGTRWLCLVPSGILRLDLHASTQLSWRRATLATERSEVQTKSQQEQVKTVPLQVKTHLHTGQVRLKGWVPRTTHHDLQPNGFPYVFFKAHFIYHAAHVQQTSSELSTRQAADAESRCMSAMRVCSMANAN